MAGPDLSYATAKVESLMDDECVIKRDVEGAGDDVLNTVTGQMTSPDPDSVTIYEGACSFRPLAQGSDRQSGEGGAVKVLTRGRLSIPLGAAQLLAGDRVELLASRRDPAAVGLEMRVTEPLYRTYPVSRVAIIEYKELVGDRP